MRGVNSGGPGRISVDKAGSERPSRWDGCNIGTPDNMYTGTSGREDMVERRENNQLFSGGTERTWKTTTTLTIDTDNAHTVIVCVCGIETTVTASSLHPTSFFY